MYDYRLSLELDDNGTILVTSPDFPLVTFGSDEASALSQAVDAAHGILASMMDAKEDIPLAPDAPNDRSPRLRLPVQTALKVELYRALKDAGLTRADLQRRLAWNRESVDRLFRLDHNSRLEQMDAAFLALGRQVRFSVAEAQAA